MKNLALITLLLFVECSHAEVKDVLKNFKTPDGLYKSEDLLTHEPATVDCIRKKDLKNLQRFKCTVKVLVDTANLAETIGDCTSPVLLKSRGVSTWNGKVLTFEAKDLRTGKMITRDRMTYLGPCK